MTATYAQTITRNARAIIAAMTAEGTTPETMSRNVADMAHLAQDQVRESAESVGIPTGVAIGEFWDEIYAPAVYVPQVGDVVVFHGDKAGHVSGSGGVGPYPVWSDDTRDEPYTMFWLHAHEMTPVFG